MLSGIEIFNFFVSDHLKSFENYWFGAPRTAHQFILQNYVVQIDMPLATQEFRS